jgi:hypothetical protein
LAFLHPPPSLLLCLPTSRECARTQQEQINYRHVIGSLLAKPGGFRDYRYRDACFPSLIFRQAWEQLNTFYPPRQADLIYLRVLHLAARTLECHIATILRELVHAATRWDERAVEQALPPRSGEVPLVVRGEVCLRDYDQLLAEVGHES